MHYVYIGFMLLLIPIFIIYPHLIRVLLGLGLVLIIPGMLLSFLLFPHELDYVERIAYGIGLSICIVVIDGLILDRLWEISLIPIVASLGIFSVAMAVAIILRKLIEIKKS